MKAIVYTALNYGAPYLAYAINSVIDAVDEYHVLYSEKGSHGAQAQMPPPPGNSEAELHAVAAQIAGDKLCWHRGEWAHEGYQRDSIYQLAPDADVILVLDYDEIYAPHQAECAINYARNTRYRTYRAPMIHYWRSFRQAFLYDPAYPIRVICPHRGMDSGEAVLPIRHVNHMGYCIPTDLLQYKMHIHGHRNEWRKDIDWFNDKWLANAQTDCHPVGSDYWNVEIVDPLKYMPMWMRLHPYFGMDVIE